MYRNTSIYKRFLCPAGVLVKKTQFRERGYITFLVKLKKIAAESFAIYLREAFGEDGGVSYSTVTKWLQGCFEGRKACMDSSGNYFEGDNAR